MAPAVPARSPLRPQPPNPLAMTYSILDKPLPQPDRLTKRQHALHELLSSERAYASDLALICEVHIPLALGNCQLSTLSL